MDALPDDEDIAGAPSRKDDGRDAVSEARPGSFVDEAALEFANGHGGFAEDGREYVTVIRDGALPPMPWLNVVANPDFGFTTTEAGGGYRSEARSVGTEGVSTCSTRWSPSH